jgi:T5orf172 domain
VSALPAPWRGGRVYVLVSTRLRPLPWLGWTVVKVGMTRHSAERRARELMLWGDPGYRWFGPWRVAGEFPVADREAAEALAHARLGRWWWRRVRVRGCRAQEMFWASERHALSVVRRVAEEDMARAARERRAWWGARRRVS